MLEFKQVLWAILVPLACGAAAALTAWFVQRGPAGGEQAPRRVAVERLAMRAAVILAVCSGVIGLTGRPAWPWELRFRAEHGVLIAVVAVTLLALAVMWMWRRAGAARDAVLAIIIATLGVGLAGLPRLRRDAAWTGEELLTWGALWGASVVLAVILLWHERAAAHAPDERDAQGAERSGHALAGASSAALMSGVLGASALAIVLAGQSLTLGLITGGVALAFLPMVGVCLARRRARAGLSATIAGLTALSGLWSCAVLWAYLPWWTPVAVSAGMAASWLGGLKPVVSRGPWAVFAVRVLAAALAAGAAVGASIVIAAPELQESAGSSEW